MCALGFACVGGVAVKRPMTSGHGPRATGGGNLSCGWTEGQRDRRSYKLASRRFLCLYLYIFYLLAFRNLFYICFTWNGRVAEAAAALSCDVLLASCCCCCGCSTPLFDRVVPVSLSHWVSVCLSVCLCAAALSTPAATDSDSCCSFPVCTLRNLLAALPASERGL